MNIQQNINALIGVAAGAAHLSSKQESAAQKALKSATDEINYKIKQKKLKQLNLQNRNLRLQNMQLERNMEAK